MPLQAASDDTMASDNGSGIANALGLSMTNKNRCALGRGLISSCDKIFYPHGERRERVDRTL